MEKEELLKRIAKAFNAGDKEVKIAYDAFLQKISEELEPGEAVRIPGYGIFQIKEKADKQNKAIDLIKNKDYQLLYYPDDLNDIVELDFSYTKKNRQNSPETAFSLSSGKPIIPILESQKKELLVQSSYLNLQTAYREKADELFNDSIKLENFSLDSDKLNIKIDLSSLQNEDIPADTGKTIPWNFGDEIVFNDSEQETIPEEPGNISAETEIFPEEPILNNNIKTADTEDDSHFEIDINDIKAFEFDPFAVSSEDTVHDEADKSNVDSSIKDENLYMNIPDFQVNNTENLIKDENEIDFSRLEDNNFNANEFASSPPEEESESESDTFKSVENEMEENIQEDAEDINSDDEDKDEVITIDVAKTQDYRTLRSAPLSEVEDNDVRVGFSKWFWIVLAALLITTGGGIYYFALYNKAGSGEGQTAAVSDKKKSEPQIIERDYEVPVTIIPKNEEEAPENITNEEDTKTEEPKEIVPEKPVETIADKKTEPDRGNKPQNESVKPAETKQSAPAAVSDFERQDSKNNLVKDFIFSDGTKYTIQLSSWKSRAIAEKEVMRLRKLGMDAYYTESYVPSAGGTRYRVRVGEYSSVQGAEDALEKMK